MQNYHELLRKIDTSFYAASKGQEDMKILIRWWGFISYAFFYLVVDTLIQKVDLKVFDIILSVIGVIYFGWHIYAVYKCKPKKPKLTKEEKKTMRQEAWRNAPRAFLRKLFLQEPIMKWNPVTMIIVLDVLFMMNFLGYLL